MKCFFWKCTISCARHPSMWDRCLFLRIPRADEVATQNQWVPTNFHLARHVFPSTNTNCHMDYTFSRILFIFRQLHLAFHWNLSKWPLNHVPRKNLISLLLERSTFLILSSFSDMSDLVLLAEVLECTCMLLYVVLIIRIGLSRDFFFNTPFYTFFVTTGELQQTQIIEQKVF